MVRTSPQENNHPRENNRQPKKSSSIAGSVDDSASVDSKKKKKSKAEADYLKSQVVLFLQSQPSRSASLHEIGKYLTVAPPSDGLFQHALEQIESTYDGLLFFVQRYRPTVFQLTAAPRRLQEESNSEDDDNSGWTVSWIGDTAPPPQQVTRRNGTKNNNSTPEDNYLKSQMMLFLQARNNKDQDSGALSHVVGKYLASVPAYCSTKDAHALEQLKSRHGRLVSFVQQHPDALEWQQDTDNSSNNWIRLVAARKQQQQNAGTRKFPVSESDALARLQKMLLRENTTTVETKSSTIVETKSSTVVETKNKRRSKDEGRQAPPRRNESSAPRIIQTPDDALRKQVQVLQAALQQTKEDLTKEQALRKHDDQQNSAKNTQQERNRFEALWKDAKAERDAARRQFKELQVSLQQTTKEQALRKNEAQQNSAKNTQEKKRIEALWKDAKAERDASRRQLKESQVSLQQTKDELLKERMSNNDMKKRMVITKQEKEHMEALWKDAVTEKDKVSKQLQESKSALQKANDDLVKERGLRGEVRKSTVKVNPEIGRFEVLWRDVRDERDKLRMDLEKSQSELRRAEAALANESISRGEASTQAVKFQNLLERATEGSAGGRQLSKLRRELQQTQERLAVERRKNDAMRPDTNSAAKAMEIKKPVLSEWVSAVDRKPRVLLRDEVPRQAPPAETPAPAPLMSFLALAGETQHHFDGMENKWNGCDGENDEMNRLDAELMFVQASYGSDEIQVEPSKVVRFLRLDIEELAESILVNLILTIPDGYPETGTLRVEGKVSENAKCSHECRKCALNALPIMIDCCRWEAQGCLGKEAILSVLSTADGWVQSDWAGLQSKHFPAGSNKKDKESIGTGAELCRMLLYSHHIVDTEKIHFLTNSASKFGLGGYVKVGKPGFVLVEGLQANCESFLENVLLQRRKLRESSRGGTDSSTFSEAGRVVETVDDIESGRSFSKKIGHLEGSDSMDLLKRACEEVDLTKYIEDACRG
jgi:hypothetical protein